MPEAHVLAGLEALLFASSEPVPMKELARLLDVDVSVIEEALEAMRTDYADPRRGFMLDEVAGGVRLVSKPAYAHLISELLRPVRNSGLSQAALETLAIVAYKQPVTRLDIETIRGCGPNQRSTRYWREVSLKRQDARRHRDGPFYTGPRHAFSWSLGWTVSKTCRLLRNRRRPPGRRAKITGAFYHLGGGSSRGGCPRRGALGLDRFHTH